MQESALSNMLIQNQIAMEHISKAIIPSISEIKALQAISSSVLESQELRAIFN